ncbi:MAG TPA: NIPSNAP family protein [Candidatus Limnocylindrales bacterium]
MNVLELRQYTLHPGRRDDLIELFDREFVETQEAEGMAVVGQFRDLDRPDRFVWLRGYADMGARLAGLTAFYGGPAWKAHRDKANETMVDSDDVLLLRPVGDGFQRPGGRDALPAARTVVATVFYRDSPFDDGFAGHFAGAMACYTTLDEPNTFPALPVRTDAYAFVVFAREPLAVKGFTADHLWLAATGRSWLR